MRFTAIRLTYRLGPVYVRRLRTSNLKRLREFELDFTHAGQPRMWTVLIGENGTAKTTILQAIALAAAGSRQVNTLAKPVVRHLRDRRSPQAALTITADFELTPRSRNNATVHPLHARATALRSEIALPPRQTSFDGTARYLSGESRSIRRRIRSTTREPSTAISGSLPATGLPARFRTRRTRLTSTYDRSRKAEAVG